MFRLLQAGYLSIFASFLLLLPTAELKPTIVECNVSLSWDELTASGCNYIRQDLKTTVRPVQNATFTQILLIDGCLELELVNMSHLDVLQATILRGNCSKRIYSRNGTGASCLPQKQMEMFERRGMRVDVARCDAQTVNFYPTTYRGDLILKEVHYLSVNLSQFSKLREIQGRLIVEDSTLQNLDFLNNLVKVTGGRDPSLLLRNNLFLRPTVSILPALSHLPTRIVLSRNHNLHLNEATRLRLQKLGKGLQYDQQEKQEPAAVPPPSRQMPCLYLSLLYVLVPLALLLLIQVILCCCFGPPEPTGDVVHDDFDRQRCYTQPGGRQTDDRIRREQLRRHIAASFEVEGELPPPPPMTEELTNGTPQGATPETEGGDTPETGSGVS